MKGFLCLLIVAFSCQSLLGQVSSDTEYKPVGNVFIQGDLPKHGISKDKIRTHTSSKVNTTRIRIEDVLPETSQDPELLVETETVTKEPATQSGETSTTEPQDATENQPQDESQEPQVEPVTTTDNTFLPCSFLPCPFNKKSDQNPKFKPATSTVKSSNSKPKVAEPNEDFYEEYQLSLEFYHSLSFQLLLISLFCLTMVLLLTAAFIAMYLSKNGLGPKRFRKLENRDCGLNKYNF